MEKRSLSPFVKWAGGKRQLLSQIKERMPKAYNNYYEPFIGGGAMLFELLPERAIINDINIALINTYRQICDNPEVFIKEIQHLDSEMWEDGKKYYYSLRERYNDKLMQEELDVELAALFVFINKHCFNGLYRVNGKGRSMVYCTRRRDFLGSSRHCAILSPPHSHAAGCPGGICCPDPPAENR